MALNYNSKGVITIQLPEGPANDMNKITLYVKVVDDVEGIASFIVGTVTVYPNVTQTADLINQFFVINGTTSVNQVLKSGSLGVCGQFVTSLGVAIDSQASSSTTVVSTTNASPSNSTGVSAFNSEIFFKAI